MAEDKILKEETLNDEQLEDVAGGSTQDTLCDGKVLNELGLFPDKYPAGYTKSWYVAERWAPAIAKIVESRGYKIEFGKYDTANKYFDKKGNSVSRDAFWNMFSAEVKKG